jgi:hypothetical protein
MDLRVPSGCFFLLLGAILIGMGALSSASAPLTSINVNLYAGIVMAIFGGWMLWLSKRTS